MMAAFLFCHMASAQNVGIGNPTPLEKLDVSGNVKANGLIINNGGAQNDFLIKNNGAGQVGFRKGHGAVGIRYMIATGSATFPSTGGNNLYDVTLIGEIKLFAGLMAPAGWTFCEGQLLQISQYQALFSILGTTYGGNGQSTFALPDLRGAVPVSPGTSTGGYTWNPGEKSN